MKHLTSPLKLLTSMLLVGTLAACSSSQQPVDEPVVDGHDYPASERTDKTFSYQGSSVSAPYYWLEQLNSEKTQQWVTQQQQFSQSRLAKLSASQFVKERLTELFNVVQVSAPIERNGKIFYLRNDGLQSQASLFMQADTNSPPIKVVDPTLIDSDGLTAITDFSVSPDATFIAYALSETGQDWSDWYIKNINTGEVLDEVISGTKFTNLSWYPDSKGFYYSRYPRLDDDYDDTTPVKVYYHSLNRQQSEDTPVQFDNQKPGINPYPQVTSDGQYLLLRVQQGPNQNSFYARPLADTQSDFKPILDTPGSEYKYLGSQQRHLYFYNSSTQGTGSVLRIPNGQWQTQETIIDEQKLPLAEAFMIGEQLITHYLQDAQSRIMTFNLQGNYLRELALPGFGSVTGFQGGPDTTQAFFKYSSFTRPGNVYRYQVQKQRTTLWQQSELPVDEERYVTRQVFVNTPDGTNIPVFLVHEKQLSLDGNNPVLLHSYGGFGQSLVPTYQADFMAWLELGGVLAVANVRGGGEFGDSWHKAAIKERKPTAISDYINVAEWLIDNRYTQKDKLAAHGRGHGGLLVTAAMAKQPDLFGVVLAEVGVYDMLRYQFANANARAWQSEFGISSVANDFNVLLSYSPLHNLQYGTCYPSTLLTTGARDQRVAPWHSYKLTAQLQYVQGCRNPVLLDVDENAGHGDKTPLWLQIERTHQQWSFALNQLQVSWLKKRDTQ